MPLQLQLTAQQFLFKHKNSNGHTDFYKVVFTDFNSGIPGHYCTQIMKNGIVFNTGFILLKPGEPADQELAAKIISQTFANTIFSN